MGTIVAVTFFVALQRSKKKRKRITWVSHGSCSGSKLQTLAALLQAAAPPPSAKLLKLLLQAPAPPPSSKLLKLLLQAPAPACSRSTFLELERWFEVGGG